MAATANSIKVLVVDGSYSGLHELGFPLPALATMQAVGVQLGQACWDIGRSESGLSVSFFWPHSRAGPSKVTDSVLKLTKSKKRRLRQKKHKQGGGNVKSSHKVQVNQGPSSVTKGS